MRVAFDVTPQLTGNTGIARYLAELTAALERAGVDVSRFAFGRATNPPPPGTKHLPLPARVIYPSWQRTGQPSPRWLAPQAELLHCGAPGLPRAQLPIVATLQDIDALRFPDLHPSRSVKSVGALLSTLDRAAAVIVGSHEVAAQLAARGLDRNRVTVVHHGVTRLPDPVEAGIEGPYFLAVGAQMPRKGFDLLIRAFGRASLAGLDGHRLVIAGPPGPQSEELIRLVLRLALGRRILFAGAVSDAELAGLYRDATAVCVPSVAEGFGLPVLEALAAGTPTLASDLAVLREVSGGHASFVTPGDERAWADALIGMLEDETLRARPRAERTAWAAQFTWERAAAQTVEVYGRVLASCR